MLPLRSTVTQVFLICRGYDAALADVLYPISDEQIADLTYFLAHLRFIAGTVGVLGLMLIAPPLACFALRFAPPKYFALMVLGRAMVAFLAKPWKSPLRNDWSERAGWIVAIFASIVLKTRSTVNRLTKRAPLQAN